jgi:thioredoxin-like negative regulator of GroEL
VNQLIAYLRQCLIVDFQGELTAEMVREYLKNDDSKDARQLLTKVVAEKGVNEMMLVLADCLVETVQRSITDEMFRENLRMYSES